MRSRRAIVTLAGLVLLPHPCAAATPPTERPAVLKVEPPSWWPGHTLNPVRVMLRGRGLTGARVETTPASGLSVGLVRVNPRGSHLFVDVTIDAEAAPGRRTLEVVTAGGRASFDLELLAPLTRAGRFQGFSADDVIYLIMPDRFANGDPANDTSPRSPDLLDRRKARHFHGGDLQGVIDRLPYLKDLGVTAIWLNPIYDNTDRLNFKEVTNGEPMTGYHGYHAEDFYAVDERFGDLAKLRELVDAAHAAGLKVIQDQVANHTGLTHSETRRAFIDFVIRSGRAELHPVYKDTYERRLKETPARPSRAYRDLEIQQAQDAWRSVDYLETRPDIDKDKLAYYGFSWGALMGLRITALDDRFKASILMAGGLDSSYPAGMPEIDDLNFAPRVRTPTLMLNGRDDFRFPLELSQQPMFRFVGTRADDKRHVLFDGGHIPGRLAPVKPTLEWLDHYLGPVQGH